MKKIKLLLVAVAIVLLHTDCSKNKNTIEDTPISETIDTKDVFKKLTINGFDSKDVSITIIGDSINVVVPYDTDLTKVKNTFDLPKGAKSDPASGEEVDFSSRTVPYIVEYEDTSKDTVKISMKKTVSIAGSIDVSGVFDGFEIYKNDIKIEDTTIDMTTEGLISIKTPYNTDLTSIKNTFTLPEGATSSPASGENVDFSTNSTNQYTVTYSDGSSEMFDITVVNREPTETMADTMNANDVFSSFEAHENSVKIEDAIIDITTESTINITTPHGTDLSLISNVFALASGATSSPASGENVDFSTNSTNKYTVTYSDGSSEMFDITVVNREPSMADMMIAEDIFTDFKIIKLGIYLSDVTPTFDDNDITVNIPYYIDLSDLKNTFTLHPDVDSFDISSGDEIDFSAPNNTRQYNVTYSDNSSETINITITSNQNITSVATYYVVFKQMYDGRVVTSPPLLPSIPYKTDISEITNFTVISDTFSQLPPGLSKHGVFEYIEVSNFNSVHLYENSFKGLIDLMALIIHDNTTISIDENTLNGLTNLMSLKIYDNTTISIDENTLNGLTNLKLLDLSNNNLTSIHENSFNFLTNLDELNLSNNNLLSIPTDLFNVSTNLRNLNLSNNDFTSIPTDSFTSSVNLRVLRLYNNLITSIPDDSLSTLSGLESLDLSFNEISDISENVFSELLSLKTLILNDNDIPSIPSNLSSSLERMHLNWNNRLYCLPQEIWNINIPQLFYGNTGISGPGDVNCNIPN